jgi:hypothetical protein
MVSGINQFRANVQKIGRLAPAPASNHPAWPECFTFTRKIREAMSALEKKEELIRKVQAIPASAYDDLAKVLDVILSEEQQRQTRFDQLLSETSVKYKAVWEALA